MHPNVLMHCNSFNESKLTNGNHCNASKHVNRMFSVRHFVKCFQVWCCLLSTKAAGGYFERLIYNIQPFGKSEAGQKPRILNMDCAAWEENTEGAGKPSSYPASVDKELLKT